MEHTGSGERPGLVKIIHLSILDLGSKMTSEFAMSGFSPDLSYLLIGIRLDSV